MTSTSYTTVQTPYSENNELIIEERSVTRRVAIKYCTLHIKTTFLNNTQRRAVYLQQLKLILLHF